ncbi:hypothetical protein V8F06_009044 [Rhypophila decipiens]
MIVLLNNQSGPAATNIKTSSLETMAPIWNPRLALGLRTDDQNEWRCVGNNPSTEPPNSESKATTPGRCNRPIRRSELGKLNRLLAAMAYQMPDQIDHNELLHLARACLCPDVPNPHRGAQEAAVIYQWTELMSAEASELRANNDRTITDADLGLPQSPRAQTFEALSSPPLYAPKPKPARMVSLKGQPRLLTNLRPDNNRPGVFFPTPIAMDRSPVKAVEQKVEIDTEKWETETVIPSPLSSLPFCFSPTTAQDIQNAKLNNGYQVESSLSGRLSEPSCCTPATTPGLKVLTPSSLPSQAATSSARELPPSPPDSAVSPQAPVSLHTQLLSPQGVPSKMELSPGDRIITTSLIIPAHHASPQYQVPLTSPLDMQKLEECSRLLHKSQAENRLLVDQISALRSELADLRREQASIQAGMLLLMWIVQAVSCFPLVVMGWAEGIFKAGFFAFSNVCEQKTKEQQAVRTGHLNGERSDDVSEKSKLAGIVTVSGDASEGEASRH